MCSGSDVAVHTVPWCGDAKGLGRPTGAGESPVADAAGGVCER